MDQKVINFSFFLKDVVHKFELPTEDENKAYEYIDELFGKEESRKKFITILIPLLLSKMPDKGQSIAKAKERYKKNKSYDDLFSELKGKLGSLQMVIEKVHYFLENREKFEADIDKLIRYGFLFTEPYIQQKK